LRFLGKKADWIILSSAKNRFPGEIGRTGTSVIASVEKEQGGQIGRIFAHWAIVYSG
jgi:hypothetical protein